MKKPIIISVILIISITAIFVIYNQSDKASNNQDLNADKVSKSTITNNDIGSPNENKDRMGNKDLNDNTYTKSNENLSENQQFTGQILAGSTTPYIDFNQKDYEDALNNNQTVLLNYYANWCPTCRTENTRLLNAFDNASTPDVIAFRVNYNDSDTDSLESQLAKEHNVSYQHTKVIIKDGEIIFNKNVQWQEEDLLNTLEKL